MKKKTLYIIGASLTILSILSFIISTFLIEYNNKFRWTIIVSTIVFCVVFLFTCVVYFSNAEFVCKKCNKQFKSNAWKSLIAIHTITRRYLHCPYCNQESWCKETWNIEK